MPDESPTTPPGRAGRGARALREIALVALATLLISVVLRSFVAQVFIIPSDSMQNTLLKDDKIVVSKVTGYHRGDVVVFADFAGWVPKAPERRHGLGRLGEAVGFLPDSSRNYLVKRVIGMPGDRVVASHGALSVNGVTLDESSYRYRNPDGSPIAAADVDFDITVPAGKLFVMGDHRNDSGDSRCHMQEGAHPGDKAFVPLDAVVGPAVAVILPVTRLNGLGVPETFTHVPAAGPAPAAPRISPAGFTC